MGDCFNMYLLDVQLENNKNYVLEIVSCCFLCLHREGLKECSFDLCLDVHFQYQTMLLDS